LQIFAFYLHLIVDNNLIIRCDINEKEEENDDDCTRALSFSKSRSISSSFYFLFFDLFKDTEREKYIF
jgi:hypothetical protein